MQLEVILQTLAELIDQGIDRLHIVCIELAGWLKLGRHMGDSIVERRLEVSDGGRERCDGLLLDLRLIVSCRHAYQDRDSAKHQKLNAVSICW